MSSMKTDRMLNKSGTRFITILGDSEFVLVATWTSSASEETWIAAEDEGTGTAGADIPSSL